MTVQPPGPQQAPPPPPPPVVDRRRPERRSGEPRRAEDRAQVARTAIVAASSICGGLAILFVFFWALGAVNIKYAAISTLIAVVLAVVWIAGFVYRNRIESSTSLHHERERRGF
jgi:membrane protein implicated in regulation of membrane protease activity